MSESVSAITLREAQESVDQWIRTVGVRYFSELTNLGILVEEVGELSRLIVSKYGDQSFKASDKGKEMADEMADVLWVLICLANQTGVDLTDAFENPALLTEAEDLDSFLKGLTMEVQEETDLGLVFGMRVALLDAIDIQRARDHGIPDYNTMRESFGLPRVSSFAEINSNPDIQQALANVYGNNIDAIDPIVGALAEELLPGASVGPLVAAGFQTQFSRLRDSDRFWYENDAEFDEAERALLRQTRFSDILRRNTGVSNIPDNVFFAVPEPGTLPLLFGWLLWQFGFAMRMRPQFLTIGCAACGSCRSAGRCCGVREWRPANKAARL